MKKRLLLLCVMVLVGIIVGSTVASVITASPECYDSDGLDPRKKGYTLFWEAKIWDKCRERYPGDEVVIERYCPDPSYESYHYISCRMLAPDTVCQNGRCVLEQPTPTPESTPEPKATHQIWSFQWDQPGKYQLGYLSEDQWIIVEEGILYPCQGPDLYCGQVITGPNPQGLWITLYFADGRHAGYWRPGLGWTKRPDELELPLLVPLK